MPFTVAWNNPDQNVMRLTTEGAWDWPDLQAALQQAEALAADQSGIVDTLVDLHDFPGAFGQFRRLNIPRHQGLVILVGANPLTGAMLNAFFRLAGQARFHFVSSMDAAYDLIEEAQVMRALDGFTPGPRVEVPPAALTERESPV